MSVFRERVEKLSWLERQPALNRQREVDVEM